MVDGHALTGGSTTTAIDTKYAAGIFDDDYFNNREFTNQTKGWTTFLTDWVKSTATWTFPTQASAAAASDVYEIHSRAAWLKSQYDDCINEAIQSAAHGGSLADKISDALSYQSGRSIYPIPSGFAYINKIMVDRGRTYITRHPSSFADARKNFRTGVSTTLKLAQSFTHSVTDPNTFVRDVYLLMSKSGSPTGNLAVQIESDSSGSPSGSVLGSASANVDVSTLPTDAPGYIRFTWANTSELMLEPDTTYWLVLTGTYTPSTTAHATWYLDEDEGYDGGSAQRSNDGTTWAATSPAADFIFTIRGQYPQYSTELRPQLHYHVIRDTNRLLHLTPAGESAVGEDGAILHLEGQGGPALPTADSDVLEVPYDYVIARAGLYLISRNPGWVKRMGTGGLETLWGRVVDDIHGHFHTSVYPGSIRVESL